VGPYVSLLQHFLSAQLSSRNSHAQIHTENLGRLNNVQASQGWSLGLCVGNSVQPSIEAATIIFSHFLPFP